MPVLLRLTSSLTSGGVLNWNLYISLRIWWTILIRDIGLILRSVARGIWTLWQVDRQPGYGLNCLECHAAKWV
jgi:hypothetical protein